MMEKKIIIHAIHSIKGGCGKSTFAFTLANILYQGQGYTKEEALNNNKVLLVDADLKGTSLKSWFFGAESGIDNPEVKSIYLEKDSKKYFNDFFKDSFFNLDDYIAKCIVQFPNTIAGEKTIYKNINIVFSSSSYAAKKPFLYSKNMKSTEKISVEYFEEKFKMFCKKLQLLAVESDNSLNNDIVEANNYMYDHIIFDLSPNSDEYTDTILRTIPQVFYTKKLDEDDKKIKYEFNHYILTLDDPAHITSTVEYIHELTSGELRTKDNGNIIIVINNNYDIKGFDMNFKQIREMFVTRLKSAGVSSGKLIKIKFIYLPFHSYFFKYLRSERPMVISDSIDFKIEQ